MKENLHFPLPRDEVKSVEEAIKKIRYAEIEYLYVFKNGKQFRRYKGEESFVNIPVQFLFELKDAIVVHNHPLGSTFSLADVETAIHQNLKELIVVTEQNIYTIKRPKHTWGIEFENTEISELLKSCENLSRSMVEKLIAQSEIKSEDREAIILHYIWVFFFNLFNIEYAKKEHPKNPI